MHDTSEHLGLPLEKPVDELNQILDIDFRKLFRSGSKAVAFGSLEDPRAVSNFIETCGAVDIVSSRPEIMEDPGKLAWLLIHDALVRAVAALLEEHRMEMQQVYDALDEDEKPRVNETQAKLSEAVEKALGGFGSHEVRITEEFFRSPKEFSAVEAFEQPFRVWLQMLGRSEQEAENMADRLPAYFLYGLNEEWREHLTKYEQIVRAIRTPFTQAAQREQEWEEYRAYLQRQVDEPVFRESFSLRQIYVPPRAYYVEEREPESKQNGDFEFDLEHVEPPSKQEREEKQVVVPLMEELKEWVDRGDKGQALRVIQGGPGIGKSSFTKMFAAQVAENRELPVLFIPLHRFDLQGDLEESLGHYLQDANHFSYNPVDVEEGEDRLLVIFDGLDELAMQGKIGAEAAKQFVQEVRNRVEVRNARTLTLQVLISGRDPVVQESENYLRKDRQVLHLLPYFFSKENPEKYVDPNNLLGVDQRDEWWSKYADLKDEDYSGLPKDLRRDQLDDITAQPLLNYLLALSYHESRIDFEDDVILNQIYRDLLTSVYERRYATGRDPKPLPALEQLDEDNFVRMLEETALVAWHRGELKTTVGDLEDRCAEDPRLKEYFETFQETVKEGVIQLVTAFYFRHTGQGLDRSRTFEFTHKSFAEYLAARRLVREIADIHSGYQEFQERSRFGWDVSECLSHWIQVAGSAPIDEFLLRFLRDEVRMRNESGVDIEEWQQTITELFNEVLRNDFPLGDLPEVSFQKKREFARNATEALIASLNACALVTGNIIKVNWPSETSARTCISELYSSRFKSRPVIRKVLSYFDFSECWLRNVFVTDSNFHNSNFEKSDLEGADLRYSNLSDANMDDTTLRRCDMSKTDVKNTSFNNAEFRLTDMVGSNILKASTDLRDVDGIISDPHSEYPPYRGEPEEMLRDVNMSSVNMRGFDLRNAALANADFEGADLWGCCLIGADLRRADLRGADLSNADLRGANLKGAQFES